MDMRHLVLCLSIAVLAVTSLVYGIKFLRKRNFLLGVEWLVITVSASNFLFFFLTGIEQSYAVSFFLDAFSRGFGIPVIAVAGLMVLTHGYRPSILADVLFFAGAIAGTCVLVGVDAVARPLPYFYLVMWSGFSVYLAYFVKRLLNAGSRLHAASVLFSLLTSLAIAVIYDFYKIPGDGSNVVFNFYVLATLTWAYQLFALYHAYDALERSEMPDIHLHTAATAPAAAMT
jgi:hypothetical protein